jgi:hypothetical protein
VAEQQKTCIIGLAVGCAAPTTNQQPKPDADAKTQSPAMTLGSRSSRADFTSSSKLKIKNELKQQNRLLVNNLKGLKYQSNRQREPHSA